MNDELKSDILHYLDIVETVMGLSLSQADLKTILMERSNNEIDKILTVKSDLRFIIKEAIEWNQMR